jgi:hypothetical protein
MEETDQKCEELKESLKELTNLKEGQKQLKERLQKDINQVLL